MSTGVGDITHFVHSRREPHVKRLLYFLLTGGGGFIDIGAHEGDFSIFAAQFCSRVTAFEPDPRSYPKLKTNLSPYDNTEVFTEALGRVNETAHFSLWENSYCSGFKTPDTRKGEEGFLDLEVKRLAEFRGLMLAHDPAVIKIDTEGHEIPIIQGMHWEQRKVPLIVEVHDTPNGASIDEWITFCHHIYKKPFIITKPYGLLKPLWESSVKHCHLLLI